jgi:hypothetical protein
MRHANLTGHLYSSRFSWSESGTVAKSLSYLAKTFRLLADIGESWEIANCPEAQSVSEALLRCAANAA